MASKINRKKRRIFAFFWQNFLNSTFYIFAKTPISVFQPRFCQTPCFEKPLIFTTLFGPLVDFGDFTVFAKSCFWPFFFWMCAKKWMFVEIFLHRFSTFCDIIEPIHPRSTTSSAENIQVFSTVSQVPWSAAPVYVETSDVHVATTTHHPWKKPLFWHFSEPPPPLSARRGPTLGFIRGHKGGFFPNLPTGVPTGREEWSPELGA